MSSWRHFKLLGFENLKFVKLNIGYHLSKFQISWLSGSNFMEVSVWPQKTALWRHYFVEGVDPPPVLQRDKKPSAYRVKWPTESLKKINGSSRIQRNVFWVTSVLLTCLCFDSKFEPYQLKTKQLNFWQFRGSSGIQIHNLRVTSPLLQQLNYRALGAVREWISVYIT